MKNVLVLKGSPRKGGNSDLLADAFISGAREAGHWPNFIRRQTLSYTPHHYTGTLSHRN